MGRTTRSRKRRAAAQSRGTEQNVDRVAVSVDGPVQVLPLADDLDVSLVQGLAYGVALALGHPVG